MSALETPPPATDRGCPRCGAPLAPDQDWCLSCGAAATTIVEANPGWRTPVAIVTGVVLVLGAILAVVFLELSDDADRAAKTPVANSTATPATTPASSSTPLPSVTATASAIPTISATPSISPVPPGASATPTVPGPTSSTVPGPTGAVASWPPGKSAWTVVLLSATNKADADKRANEVSAGGHPAGVLHSDDYSSLRSGYWVVFSGQYDSSDEAQQAADSIGASAAGSYVRFVKPK